MITPKGDCGISYRNSQFFSVWIVTDYFLGHTLLHEITHLDTFGLAVGLSKDQDPGDDNENIPPFDYHGTVDWNDIGDASNARDLKNEKDAEIDTYENAESWAAMATGKYPASPHRTSVIIILS